MSQAVDVREPVASLGALVVSEMRLMYGSKFAQQWEGLTPRDLRDSWNQKLAGLTEAEIRAALVACLTREWPPTLPEFLRLCRPWLNPEVAYRAATAGMAARRKGEVGAWPHPAVYWAAVEIGSHDLLSLAWPAIRGRWEAAYQVQLARSDWEPIPAPAVALPAPGKTEASNLEAAQALHAIGADGTLNPPKRDPKDWARKILANPAGRTPTVLAMARRALEQQEAA